MSISSPTSESSGAREAALDGLPRSDATLVPRRVLLVEDADWMQKSLSDLIQQTPGLDLAGAVASADAARTAMKVMAPDVVMIDAMLPGISGLDFCREVKAASPHHRVLIMSVQESVLILTESVAAQADGFVSKNRSWEVLREALLTVAAGNPWFDPAIPQSQQLGLPVLTLTSKAAKMRVQNLTPRQQLFLALVAAGHDYKAISAELKVNPQTVNNNMLRIREQLAVLDNQQAVELWHLAQVKGESDR